MKFLGTVRKGIENALKWAALVSAIVAGLQAFSEALPKDKE